MSARRVTAAASGRRCEHVGRKRGQGIGMGIDPGRQVDERLRGCGKAPPCRAEVAAMFERRRIQVEHHGVGLAFLAC